MAAEDWPVVGLEPITVSAIQASVISAVAKHGRSRTPLSRDMPDGEKLAILVEEVGEVARAMTYDEGDKDDLVKELLQVAAMAACWAEALG